VDKVLRRLPPQYCVSYLPMQLLRRAAGAILRLPGVNGVDKTQRHSEDEIKILLRSTRKKARSLCSVC
jgi:hypothetical protein